jgi:cytochrome c-type biogenesis protein CcmH/NrfG
MAEAYFKLKKWEHADISYTMALAKEPSTPRWWYRLGQVREFKGEFAPALAAYERALALQPGLAEAAQGRERVRGQAQ